MNSRCGTRWCCPKFTFPTFTPDPNLHTPHIYTRPKFTQTQIYTRPKFTQTQIYTNPFLDIYFKKPKFTQPKFTQNPNLHNPNLHKTKKEHNFALQIYTKLNPNLHGPKFTQTQIYITERLKKLDLPRHSLRAEANNAPMANVARSLKRTQLPRFAAPVYLTNQEIMSHLYIHFWTIVARGSRTRGSNVAFGSLRPFGPGSTVNLGFV